MIGFPIALTQFDFLLSSKTGGIGIKVSPQQTSWLINLPLTKLSKVTTSKWVTVALLWALCLLEGFGHILTTNSTYIPFAMSKWYETINRLEDVSCSCDSNSAVC